MGKAGLEAKAALETGATPEPAQRRLGRVSALYFSGNGNTAYATRVLAGSLGANRLDVVSIEEPAEKIEVAISAADTVVIAYPNYMCVLPKIVKDFLTVYGVRLANKRLIALVTFARFCFDADLQAFRLLRRLGVPFTPLSNISVQMPMVICDMRLMAETSTEEARTLKREADKRLAECATTILGGGEVHDGQESQRLASFLRQRMYYQGKMSRDFAKLRVTDACVGCGLCARACPTSNFEMRDGKACPLGRCTQCYRCANACPKRAILIWGRQVQWQYWGIEGT
jgi:ferredoxin